MRNQQVGETLRALREHKGISARALSLSAGLSGSYVGKIENGKCDPSLRTFAKIVAQLGLSADEAFLILRQEAGR